METRNNKVIKVNGMSALDHLEIITKKNRSRNVKDHDYGQIKTANAENRDKPVYAVFKYDNAGNLVYEDYSKLEEIIDKEVIPNNIKDTHIRNPETNERIIAKTIQGNALTKLRLSEKEMEFALTYLAYKGIIVRGSDSSLDSEFDGYQYISTYKNQDLPEGFTMLKNFEVFSEYQKLKDRVANLPKDSQEKIKMESQLIKIRNTLIEGNMRLVCGIIRKQMPKLPRPMDEEDIYQIGYEALINYIEKFDVELGYAFSTYIYNTLMLKVLREYDQYQNFHIPVHIQDRVRKIKKVKEAIEMVKGSEATIEEIADEMDLPIEKIQDALLYAQVNSVESYDAYREIKQEEQYQDFIDDEDELEYDEMETRLYRDSVESEVSKIELEQLISKALDTLTEREADVLKLRFGLIDGRQRTLEEVGQIFGYTRERIRQIENKAIRKLRHPKRTKQIRDYYLSEDEPVIQVNSHHRH